MSAIGQKRTFKNRSLFLSIQLVSPKLVPYVCAHGNLEGASSLFAECFFHTLKVELIHGKIYDTRQKAKIDIFDYIEIFYNRQRRHSYLGYLSPVDFEKKNAA